MSFLATEQQPPATPAKAEAPTVPATPASAGPIDMSQLDDAGIRQFLSTNTTVKNIVAANIKKKLEVESNKLKTELESTLKNEYESKISSAREQAQLMESKKSTLRINMAENKLRAANAKIGVVEKAASETPQKPVVEVWDVAKTAQAPPPVPAAAKPAPARQGSVAGVPPSPAPATPAKSTQPAPTTTPAGAPPTAEAKPAQAQAAAPATSGIPPPKANNPFAASTNAASTSAPNPFAPKNEGGAPAVKNENGAAPAAKEGQPQAQQAQQGQPKQQQQGQQQGQQPVRTGIPMPRGGGRGRGGAYVPPGQRAASGTQEGGQGHAGRGGRGGRGGARGGMNPGANDFQPGNKRPRGDSEVGGGAKRARGAH